MTNEENQRCAINYLIELKKSTKGYGVNWLDLAIKALEFDLDKHDEEVIKNTVESIWGEPCEDCISREDAIRIAEQGQIQGYEWQFKKLCNLPSVTPQPRTGHWIDTGSGQECSECGEIQYGYDNFRCFCTNCGAKIKSEVEE